MSRRIHRNHSSFRCRWGHRRTDHQCKCDRRYRSRRSHHSRRSRIRFQYSRGCSSCRGRGGRDSQFHNRVLPDQCRRRSRRVPLLHTGGCNPHRVIPASRALPPTCWGEAVRTGRWWVRNTACPRGNRHSRGSQQSRTSGCTRYRG
jgi:hypothetical protein